MRSDSPARTGRIGNLGLHIVGAGKPHLSFFMDHESNWVNLHPHSFFVWSGAPSFEPKNVHLMSNWEKLSQKTMYEGFRNIVRKTFRLPNGKTADFDIMDVPSFVCIAAISKDKQIILVDQYRPGPEFSMVSFPEGRIDPGEVPEQAVERELREETGYTSPNIRFLKSIPHAYTNQTKYIYLAQDCELVQAQELDDLEFIQVKTLSLEEFRAYLLSPQITDFNSVDAGYLLLDQLGLL